MADLPITDGLFTWHQPESLIGYNDGDHVSQWPDSGPRGVTLYADYALATNTEPYAIYVASGLNGVPGLRHCEMMNLKYDEYRDTHPAPAAQRYSALTSFVVGRADGANGFATYIHGPPTAEYTNTEVRSGYFENGWYVDASWPNAWLSITTHDVNGVNYDGYVEAPTPGNAGVLIGIKTGSSARLYLGPKAVGTDPGTLADLWDIEHQLYGYHALDIVHEQITYNRELNDAEIAAVTRHLISKYGLGYHMSATLSYGQGSAVNQPAAGLQGRLHKPTDRAGVYFDTGSAWVGGPQ